MNVKEELHTYTLYGIPLFLLSHVFITDLCTATCCPPPQSTQVHELIELHWARWLASSATFLRPINSLFFHHGRPTALIPFFQTTYLWPTNIVDRDGTIQELFFEFFVNVNRIQFVKLHQLWLCRVQQVLRPTILNYVRLFMVWNFKVNANT